MSEEESERERNRRLARERLDVAMMNADRPLDALLPTLREPALPKTAVHPRVLEVETEDGIEWALLVWADPGGPQQLHQDVQALVEATLLSELSRAPSEIAAQGERRFSGLRLIVFTDPGWDIEPAVRAFGFRRQDAALAEDAARAVAAEAEKAGRTVGQPSSVWRAEIRRPAGALGESLEQIQRMMAQRLGQERWGSTPGGFSHLFATYLMKTFGEKIRPDVDGLASLDLLVVQRDEDVIRWMPPLVFQALCDFLPVAAASLYDAKVSWAESEDLGGGFSHPPLIRVEQAGEGIHIPIGHHVLRWWMMPLFPGEQVPSLGAWLADQFANEAD